MPINTQWQPLTVVAIGLIPERAGVYELGNKYTNGIIKTIYIGKAGGNNTLKGRISQHTQESEPNPCIKNYAQFFRYEITGDYDSRERQLLEEYRRVTGSLPPCNSQLP